jgi:hypothetical protein
MKDVEEKNQHYSFVYLSSVFDIQITCEKEIKRA